MGMENLSIDWEVIRSGNRHGGGGGVGWEERTIYNMAVFSPPQLFFSLSLTTFPYNSNIGKWNVCIDNSNTKHNNYWKNVYIEKKKTFYIIPMLSTITIEKKNLLMIINILKAIVKSYL